MRCDSPWGGIFLSKVMKLSIPEQHQKKIAIQTLRMSDAGASIMGGMSKDEARAFLARIGYKPEMIVALEGGTAPRKNTTSAN
jgi:hypothetical protein